MPSDPIPLAEFHSSRPGLFRPVRTDPAGLEGPTPQQAKGPKFRRTSRGLYLPVNVSDEVVEQRIVEAAVLLPEYGGVTGWAALRWAGGHWFDGLADDGLTRLPVILAVMHSAIRSQPGIRVTSERLAPGDLTMMDGLAVTSLVRSVCYEMRYARNDRQATVKADMAAIADLASIAEIRAYASTLSGWTGIPQCLRGLELADENSWSPQEVLMRLHWELDAGFPRPLCNAPVFDRTGRHIGTPDLLDVEAGVVGEYDGAMHLEGRRRGQDLRREDAFRRAGLEYFTMVAADKVDPDNSIVPRMIETRARARWAPESRRDWTVEPPPWWTPTSTVEQRRQLSAEQRERWLRRGAG